MVKNKYFYYLFLINALINIINFVPRGLIEERFKGGIMAMVAAVPIGLLLIYLFTRVISKFPGQGLPEIYSANFPRFLSSGMLAAHSLFWYIAGLITLISFVDVTMRYITSDVPPFLIMIGFLIVVCLSMRLTSDSILYALEVLIVLNVPVIIYVLLKAFFNPFFNWDAVMQVVTYSFKVPSYSAIADATFIFSGYINLVIFNRVFKNLKVKHMFMLGVMGFLILLISFFIPIAYQGTIGVERHVYPWFSTADVMRTKNFIVERVLFFFYFTYLTLSLVSSIVHWHVSLELLKGIFKSKEGKKPNRGMDWWIIAPFMIIALASMMTGQFIRNRAGLWFLDIRLAAEVVLVCSLYIAYKRRRRRKV